MTELVLLLPLKVLPGWPEPEPVSGLFLVMLCIVGPLALGAVIAAIANAPRLLRRGREDALAVGLGDAPVERAELESAHRDADQAPTGQTSIELGARRSV